MLGQTKANSLAPVRSIDGVVDGGLLPDGGGTSPPGVGAKVESSSHPEETPDGAGFSCLPPESILDGYRPG